eukprot:RCo039048
MLLSALPVELVEFILKFLTLRNLARCCRVCSGWRSIVVVHPQLRPRVDVTKAVELFNEKAELGIEFVTQTVGMIPSDPDAIAEFLTLPQLSKQQIGRYLGQKKHKDVLEAVLGSHDYNGLHLDEALRKCFQSFAPVMTGSEMHEVLRAFSRRFCKCNPHYFCEAQDEACETGYLLCFAMLMLNTDAHNNMVQTKMTRQQFVAYIFSSLDLKVNIHYLEGLYNRVVSHEIKPPSQLGVLSRVRSALRRFV